MHQILLGGASGAAPRAPCGTPPPRPGDRFLPSLLQPDPPACLHAKQLPCCPCHGHALRRIFSRHEEVPIVQGHPKFGPVHLPHQPQRGGGVGHCREGGAWVGGGEVGGMNAGGGSNCSSSSRASGGCDKPAVADPGAARGTQRARLSPSARLHQCPSTLSTPARQAGRRRPMHGTTPPLSAMPPGSPPARLKQDRDNCERVEQGAALPNQHSAAHTPSLRQRSSSRGARHALSCAAAAELRGTCAKDPLGWRSAGAGWPTCLEMVVVAIELRPHNQVARAQLRRPAAAVDSQRQRLCTMCVCAGFKRGLVARHHMRLLQAQQDGHTWHLCVMQGRTRATCPTCLRAPPAPPACARSGRGL